MTGVADGYQTLFPVRQFADLIGYTGWTRKSIEYPIYDEGTACYHAVPQTVKKVSEGGGGVEGEPSGFPTPRNNHPPAGDKSGEYSPLLPQLVKEIRRSRTSLTS